MQADGLKLTSYFGERHRSDGRFLADALLDLYGRRQVATSVLLRGALGFGIKHQLRTDRLLTLSEDLPLVAVAIDERAKIEALAEEVVSLTHTGLITLERARMIAGSVAGDPDAAELDEPVDEETKLTVYVGRRDRIQGRSAYVAICDLLHRRAVAGATVLLGVDGTARGTRQRARFFGGNANVPLMVIAIGRGHDMAAVLPELRAMVPEAPITLERVRICKRDGQLRTRPATVPGTDERGLGLWQKLMIYSSEQAEHAGQPQHLALIERLRTSGIRGATTVRGIWGFHGQHAPHGDRLLQIRRHVPTVTIVVDTPPRIAEAFEIVDAATAQRGLVTSELIPALTAVAPERSHGGLRLARRLP